jgi:Cyclic nucleotide-binding domain/PilZ domain
MGSVGGQLALLERRGTVGAAASVLDARADPRVAAGLPVGIENIGEGGRLRARARDLSVGGACIATECRFGLDWIRAVNLQLGDGPLRLAVKACWQSPSGSEGEMLTGLAFSGLSDRLRTRLWDEVHRRTQEVARFLHDGSELGELGLDDALSLAGHTRLRSLGRQKVIYRQGHSTQGEDSVMLVLEGKVSLRREFSPTSTARTADLGVGALFGGLPSLADVEQLETAVAVTPVELLEISRASYYYLRVAKPLLAQRLARLVVRSWAHRASHYLQLMPRI